MDNIDVEVSHLEQLGERRKENVQDYLCIMEAPSGHIFCVTPVQNKLWPVGAN